MKAEIAETITFGRDGNAREFQRRGWSNGEGGYTWAIGEESEIAIPFINCPDGMFLEFYFSPYVVHPALSAQRLRVLINGVVVVDEDITGEGVFAWRGPPLIGPALIRLEHPNARMPKDLTASRDNRLLAFACRRLRLVPALDPPGDFAPIATPWRELALRFCSLGENCEVGQAQRLMGAEPIDLFRWARLPLNILMHLIRDDFDGLDDADMFEVRTGDREYLIKHKYYGFTWHTWTSAAAMTQRELIARETRRLPFLARKLKDDLAEGHRIFVVRDADISDDDAYAARDALRRYGAPQLMVVRLGDGIDVTLREGVIFAALPQFADWRDVPGTTNRGNWHALFGRAATLVPHLG